MSIGKSGAWVQLNLAKPRKYNYLYIFSLKKSKQSIEILSGHTCSSSKRFGDDDDEEDVSDDSD